MKKILIGVLLLIIPGISFAQNSITNFPVGTCKQIGDGFFQQMPDGTWASPSDRLNTCEENGIVWNYQSQMSPWGNQYGYNPQLADMDTAQFILMCMVLGAILPQAQCQGYNPYTANAYNQFPAANNYLQYPSLGRNYIAIGGNNATLSVSSDDSGDFWKTALIGIGMGWLLNRLTS